MLNKGIILFIVLVPSFEYITYDQNLADLWFGWPTSNCFNTNYTFYFYDTFKNIPQIIIWPHTYDMNYYQPNAISFDIVSTSYSAFIVNIKCPYTYKSYKVRFRWAAIDDKRIEVINQFNFNTIIQGSQTLPPISHSNFNALQGFISVIGFGYSNGIDFYVEIVTITTSDVTFKVSSYTAGLISIGFQIILGTKEAFQQSSLIIFYSLTGTNFYKSGALSYTSGQKLWFPWQGFTYSRTKNVKLIQLLYSDTGSTISYDYQSWDDSYFDKFIHKQVWFNSQNSFVRQPLLLKKMRVSKNFEMPKYSYFIQLEITEFQKSYTSTVTEKLFIQNTTSTISMIAKFQCPTGYKISGYVLKSISGDKAQVSNYCFKGINYVTYFIKLQQVNQEFQEIKVEITSVSITITQAILNQVETIYTVLSLVFSS